MTSSEILTGAGTLGNEMDPLDADGLKLGALEITEDRYKKNALTREKKDKHTNSFHITQLETVQR